MPAIVADQRFESLQHFKDALRDWAIEDNFTPHILDSDRQRVRAGCRSAPNCPFRIRVNYNAKLGCARVTNVDKKHTCAAGTGQLVPQNIKRAETAKVSFLIKAVPQLLEVTKETHVNRICEAVEQKYGQKIAPRQAQKVKRVLLARPCRECHQFGHSRRSCPQRSGQAGANEANGENANADNDSSDGGQLRTRPRCTLCFVSGHNRQNCPNIASIEQRAQQREQAIQNQLNAAAYAPTLPPGSVTEGTYTLEHQMDDGSSPAVTVNQNGQAPSQPLAAPARPFPPNRSIDGGSGTANTPQPGQTPQVPNGVPHQNPKMEAARLMQQASKLMQEAARLNFEAAKLTASAAE